ncbi:MAG TPA: ROK family protein [Chitinophagaceae bacterium]|nr:ROK family protein [Chitinophagaceae bacterium]
MPVIALDLGGTKLASALLSDEGDILISETVQLEKRKGNEVGSLIVKQANLILQSATEKKIVVSSLGICVPGIAHAKTVWAPNIPGWEDYPLLEQLQEEIESKNINIKIDSDRACYILAEVWKGNARGFNDVIFLNVGTGIGAGIMTNNQVLRGANDIGGAIGWMALNKPFDKKFIPCGCFEYNASGEGLVKVAKELIIEKKITESILNNTLSELSAKDIFTAYDANDKLAIMVINNAIEYWGMAVANLVSLFNPEKIIFGGGVFGPALKFLDAIYEEAKKWAQPISMQRVKLEGAALGNEAGLYGAGYLALKG